jgi:hypothetical protein
MLRLACLLAIAAQILLIVLFLDPNGRTAILFAFVGNPLLALGILLGLLWWWRTHRGRSDATMDPGSGAGARPGGGG